MSEITNSRTWLLLGLSVFVASAQGSDQILRSRLSTKVEGELRVSGNDLVHVLTQINERLLVPIGLVIIKDANVRASSTLGGIRQFGKSSMMSSPPIQPTSFVMKRELSRFDLKKASRALEDQFSTCLLPVSWLKMRSSLEWPNAFIG